MTPIVKIFRRFRHRNEIVGFRCFMQPWRAHTSTLRALGNIRLIGHELQRCEDAASPPRLPIVLMDHDAATDVLFIASIECCVGCEREISLHNALWYVFSGAPIHPGLRSAHLKRLIGRIWTSVVSRLLLRFLLSSTLAVPVVIPRHDFSRAPSSQSPPAFFWTICAS